MPVLSLDQLSRQLPAPWQSTLVGQVGPARIKVLRMDGQPYPEETHDFNEALRDWVTNVDSTFYLIGTVAGPHPYPAMVRDFHRQLAQIPFEWHHHPEYELTLTMNSRGRRFIGDHIADYSGDDLVLVPPDMPHTWASTEPIDDSAPQVAIVVWFSGDWARRMADCCPEFASLRTLLRRAAPGLRFSTEAATLMRARMEALLDQ